MYLNEMLKLDQREFQRHSRTLLEDRQLARTSSARFLWRQNFFEDYEKKKEKIFNHVLDSQNQKVLSRTIAQRVKTLQDTGTLLRGAMSKGDWTAQVLSLNILHRESLRFYRDILALPMPDGLNEDEEKRYLALLSQQATPYKKQADEFEKKLQEFWKGDDLVEGWEKQYQASSFEVREKLAMELRLLWELAP